MNKELFKSFKEYDRHKESVAFDRYRELSSKMQIEGLTEKELKELDKIDNKYNFSEGTLSFIWNKILDFIGMWR